MRIARLRDELLIGAVVISVVVALASMLAVSVVIRQQYLDQSNATLTKASRVIEDSLADRQKNLLLASRQLASQKNLGSTLWYLAQYAQTGLDQETLANTYQQLARDTHKIGRVAGLTKVAIYDVAGNLVSFAQRYGKQETVGFVEHAAEPVFMQVYLKEGEELNSAALRPAKMAVGFDLHFEGVLPQQEISRFALSGGRLAIESQVPIMGVAFDQSTGKQEVKQLGLVAAVLVLDEMVVEHLSRLTDARINIFTVEGLSSGSLADYQQPDWGRGREGVAPQSPGLVLNETLINQEAFYQCLIPVFADKRLVGSIAVLQSTTQVSKNTWQMVRILGLIAAACMLIILPLAWFFAMTVSRPLTTLSRICRSLADGEQSDSLKAELIGLEQQRQRHNELNDLTQSFVAMDRAISQKLEQINEINSSLEQAITLRTAELSVANQELSNLALRDTLTGLPNRKLLADRVPLALASARRDQAQLALLFIDLDEFKPVNDTFGHDVGDELLKDVAKRIEGCVRASDTVARFGGDEFIVLLPLIESVDDALSVAEKIRLAISTPFQLVGQSLHVSTSIGIATFPEHGTDEATLLKHADMAMYQAKTDGRNLVRVYSPVA
jgi:diguanylate cyclase (GGDEF)-like protein